MITLPSPTRADLNQLTDKELTALQSQLTYVDQRVDFKLQKDRKNHWLLNKIGPEAFEEHIRTLTLARKPSLLMGQPGSFWTYSGLAPRLAESMGRELRVDYQLPEAKLVPWDKVPEFEMRYYQKDSLEALLKQAKFGPAAVEIATGLGKSFIIQNIPKRIGRQTVVMAPSISIARQLYKDMKLAFGLKRVALFGDGKKEIGKLITIAIDDSLSRVKPGTKEWEFFSQTVVFIADESHLCPAKTLKDVCFGLLANAPYRFFFSGTQTRTDGLDLVLEGITGPVVYEMTVREGVDQGFLSKPVFSMLEVPANGTYENKDVNEMTRHHLFYNPAVNRAAADFANKAVKLLGRQVVILIDEVEQFTHLHGMLQHEAGFAHGTLTAANRDKVPKLYHKSDPEELVERFNAGNLPILIGTSCISTGTDIRNAGALIRIKGGTSEIEVRQDIGRGTRLTATKKDTLVLDFDPKDVPSMHRHAKVRRQIFEDIYPGVRMLRM